MEITFNRVETHISDYRTGTKNKEEDAFVKFERDIESGVVQVEHHSSDGVRNITSTLSGENNLFVKTVTNDEHKNVISEGRFLNTEIKDALFEKSFQGQNIQIEAIQSDLGDRVIAQKIIRDTTKDKIIAVVQEVHYSITEEEFDKAIG